MFRGRRRPARPRSRAVPGDRGAAAGTAGAGRRRERGTAGTAEATVDGAPCEGARVPADAPRHLEAGPVLEDHPGAVVDLAPARISLPLASAVRSRRPAIAARPSRKASHGARGAQGAADVADVAWRSRAPGAPCAVVGRGGQLRRRASAHWGPPPSSWASARAAGAANRQGAATAADGGRENPRRQARKLQSLLPRKFSGVAATIAIAFCTPSPPAARASPG